MSREEIIAANPIADFVRSRGHELKAAGENFVTSGCPVKQHKKYHRPNTIDPAKNLWHCNDCCGGGTVIDWLSKEKRIPIADAMRELGGGKNDSEPVAMYDYTDEHDELLYQVCRFDPKDFRARRGPDDPQCKLGIKGVRRVLYRLPEVIKAQLVCIAEGEKNADDLSKLGFVATTNVFGAGKWRDEYNEFLHGKDVVVFGDVGDPDRKGEKHTEQVIASLSLSGISPRHALQPDGFHDVSDYTASLPANTAARAIAKLIDEAKFTPTPTPKVTVTSESSEETLTELTSLTSLADAEYPAPPDEASYYGLAGDIVRRIEPHTEADPVALLIQIIVAFGNTIGRNPHALADGARHAMNLSAVLVGETSKARKGTAWAHIRRLFKRADEQWAQDCIANGLSSGEGVIWAVRDPITRSVKNKTTGHYDDEISDAGIEDKRLCVVEGEFANVLKVMTREGNTLSPVLRSAWDSGELRSITKNSPARATEAHVSIIGHITRHELRRLLTETESANGSANRWLFLGVRRSKRLPEGGNIGSDSMNDLVTRLKEAIEFARHAGQVTRSDEARAVWARIYPELSEGKPGLLGAITARAEAQVLRLSVIYGLLDCSNAVRVEHLKAALALWSYSERSAVWVFEIGTGNKNADKILAALKAAGQKGLTRLQITNEVFNRHATKFEIDEALRLLHSLKLADRKLEGTATRPAERWFYQAQRCEVCEQSTPRDGKTGDTSHYSPPAPSKNANSAESDTEAETVGDESGVARL